MIYKILFFASALFLLLIVASGDAGTIEPEQCLLLGLVAYAVIAVSGIKAGFLKTTRKDGKRKCQKSLLK